MSRTAKYVSSSWSRQARSSLKPRPIADTMSRTFTARNLSLAPDSSIVTSPDSESTRTTTPVSPSRRFFVSPPGPMSTPMRSCGIRAYSISAAPEASFEPPRVRVHADAREIPCDVPDVPPEPVVAPRMREGHRLSTVDHPRPSIPPEEVVFAQVPVDEFRVPHRRHRGDHVLVRHRRGRKPDLADHGSGHRVVADVLHEEAVLVHRHGFRDEDARLAHPLKVLELLLRPHGDHLAERAPDLLEPRVPPEILREGPERRRVHAVDFQGGPARSGRRVEHVPLLSRAHGIIHRGDRPVGDQLVHRHERGLVEDLVVRLPLVRVLLDALQDLDAFLEQGQFLVIHPHGDGTEPGYGQKGAAEPTRAPSERGSTSGGSGTRAGGERTPRIPPRSWSRSAPTCRRSVSQGTRRSPDP